LTDSRQLLLLPSSEDDAWDGNAKSIAVTQQLQGSCHWETLELFMVCAFSIFAVLSLTIVSAYLNGLLLLHLSKL
jgi:hypothetical protein